MMEKLSDDPRFEQISENYRRIQENIAAAAEKSGRKASDIRFMAVTKTVEPVYINHALSLGIDLIGENKVQEFLGKREYLHLEGCEKHLIGHLQTNKVRQIIGEVDMIESVDSVRLAQEISRQAVRRGLEAQVLLEVNIGGEESKSGMEPEAMEETACQIAALPGVQVRGLMAIPPICEKDSVLRGFFANMYRLFIDMQAKKIDNINMDILSMGMSGDYVQAIEEGANLVRIGSALFGARVY
ncbi:MAG TPA: YggS family pyridoxal phosphate-dependent enzyme [Candidatus Fimivicinus intestinavium]|nr:YggS family pyridoxal phosphate-dependent enzyme [Candidatus Fimivicinus intestinavium]